MEEDLPRGKARKKGRKKEGSWTAPFPEAFRGVSATTICDPLGHKDPLKLCWMETASPANTARYHDSTRLAGHEAFLRLWTTNTYILVQVAHLCSPAHLFSPGQCVRNAPFVQCPFSLFPRLGPSIQHQTLWRSAGFTSETESHCPGLSHWLYFCVHRTTQGASSDSVLRCSFPGTVCMEIRKGKLREKCSRLASKVQVWASWHILPAASQNRHSPIPLKYYCGASHCFQGKTQAP